MLRMRFLASDYNPQLLVLGEKPDLAAFAEILKTFARTGAAIDLAAAGVVSTNVQVTLSEPEPGETMGLWPQGDMPNSLHWRVPREAASAFAEDVDAVAAGRDPAGSATLECQVRGETPVKATTGEWEDAFFGER